MSDLVEQIDALLALNAKGAVSHPVPGLAVDLLERAKAELSLRQSHSTGAVAQGGGIRGMKAISALIDEGGLQKRCLVLHFDHDVTDEDRQNIVAAHNAALSPVHKDGEPVAHPDDEAVDRFAAAMKAKLAKKRAEGRGGWENKDECSAIFLSSLLHGHVIKGDPVDVANLAMMLHQRGESILQTPNSAEKIGPDFVFSMRTHPKEAEVTVTEEMVEGARCVYLAKVEEYDHDFERVLSMPDGAWEQKYGTNLHSTALGQNWAMRAALVAALSRKG